MIFSEVEDLLTFHNFGIACIIGDKQTFGSKNILQGFFFQLILSIRFLYGSENTYILQSIDTLYDYLGTLKISPYRESPREGEVCAPGELFITVL